MIPHSTVLHMAKFNEVTAGRQVIYRRPAAARNYFARRTPVAHRPVTPRATPARVVPAARGVRRVAVSSSSAAGGQAGGEA